MPPAAEVDLSAAAALAVDEHRAAPGAVVAAAVRRHGVFVHGIGAAGRLFPDPGAAVTMGGSRPPNPRATPETLFDLASVTKPVTALTLARLSRAGRISRAERLGDVLPSLAATRSGIVPLDLLAAHRAGLDGHRPLYAPLARGEAVDLASALVTAADARREGCEGPPPPEGFPPVYSDLGYLLLGAALAARGEADLDAVMAREVTAPLGLRIASARRLRAVTMGDPQRVPAVTMGDPQRVPAVTMGDPQRVPQTPPGFDETVAPTEVVAWRGGAVRGAVHDENAWALGGDAACGHAGLFGDARSVLDLGIAVLDVLAGRLPSFLDPEDLAPLIRDRPGGSLLAGFDRRSGPTPLSGSRFGARTFGHLGFTGTSLWIDPDAELVGVLLTNRVHPTRATDAIRRARPAVYDALADAMLGWRGVHRRG
jgi:CubicO group peptidase (beta-lactamase class C family)